MRNKSWAVGLLVSVAASAGPAVAADLTARPPMTGAAVAQPVPPSPPPLPDWTGFYLGINGGGGTGHVSFDQSQFVDPFSFGTLPNASPSGGVFGGQFGHNWQWGQAVGGLEVDFDGADIKDSTTSGFPFAFPSTFSSEFKIDELASVRGRLGYLIWPNMLLYGTAGVGWGHFQLSNQAFGFDMSETTFANEFGWVAGAGLEWKFFEHWFLRGEWLHYDFGKVSLSNNNSSLNGGIFPFDNGNVRTTVDIGRAALSYKF